MPKRDMQEPDEMSSMLQSQFDVSVSMAGDIPYHDEGRYSTLGRRPVIIAPQPHRDGESITLWCYSLNVKPRGLVANIDNFYSTSHGESQ